MSLVVLFFGCDKTWIELNQSGFHRRNTHMLHALTGQEEVIHILNVHFASRSQFIRKQLHLKKKNARVTDVYVTNYVPGPKFIVNRVNLTISRFRLKTKLLRAGSNSKVLSWCYLSTSFQHFKSHWDVGQLIVDLDHNQIEAIHAPSNNRLTTINAASTRATLTISSSRSMNDWIESHSLGPSKLILNGVDSERFKKLHKTGHKSHLRVGYIGSLSKWINYEGFIQIVESNPNVQFIIAGKPYRTEKWTALSQFPNVQLIGFLPPSDVPKFLQEVDLTLNLYQRISGLDVNSMKIYESLACHTPVASLEYHKDLHADFSGLVKTFANPSDLGQSLQLVASLGNDNSWRELVDNFIENSTWEYRVSQTLKALPYG